MYFLKKMLYFYAVDDWSVGVYFFSNWLQFKTQVCLNSSMATTYIKKNQVGVKSFVIGRG